MHGRLRDLAVVIVTYCSAREIRGALSTLPPDAVGSLRVVDNASTDDTLGVLETLDLPAGTVLKSESNLGFGRACNVGLAASPPSRWVLFLNPDARVTPAAVAKLLAYLDDHPDVAMVGPRLFSDAEPLPSAGRYPSIWTELRGELPGFAKKLLPSAKLRADHSATGPVDVVEGACMAFDRGSLESAGGFDERYFLFFEELDIARRLARDSRSVALVADAAAQHAVGASRKQQPLAGRSHYYESAKLYFEHWHGPKAARRYVRMLKVVWTIKRLVGQLDRPTMDKLSAGLG